MGMRTAIKRALGGAVGLAMVALGPSGEGGRTAWADEAGEAVFHKYCFACHTTERGRNRVGPSLYAVFGRPAGLAASSFIYSEALRSSGLTWDAATLDAFITNPKQQIPDTKMSFAGVSDPAERAQIIAYLKNN